MAMFVLLGDSEWGDDYEDLILRVTIKSQGTFLYFQSSPP